MITNKLKKILIICILIYTTASINVVARPTALVASFNTLHLGWKGKDYRKTAEVIAYFDLIGLQEVMKEDGLKKLEKELEKLTKTDWEYHISDKKVGNSRYKEYYGYIWQSDSVTFLKSHGFYDEQGENPFTREPYAADFKIGEFDFTFAIAHFIYGKRKSDRRAEGKFADDAYTYFQMINGEENDVIFAGDFNLPAHDKSFSELFSHSDEIFYAVDPKNKTTIGKSGLASSYDNMFFSYKYTKEYTGRYGVHDFTDNNHSIVRKNISDHLPIYMEFYIDADDD